MEILNVLGSIGAPLLGAVLGGPPGLAAGAISLVTKGLGISSNSSLNDIVKKIEKDPEAAIKVKQLEVSYQQYLVSVRLQMDQAEYADRASARSREVDITKATGKRDWAPSLIGGFVVVTFTLIICVLIVNPPKKDDLNQGYQSLINVLVGALAAGYSTVLGYYFGSSVGSRGKDQSIATFAANLSESPRTLPPQPSPQSDLTLISSQSGLTSISSQLTDRWDDALTKAQTNGASAKTANQDNLPEGIDSSNRMAQADWSGIEPIKERFYKASVKYEVPPAILAGIASRESRVAKALNSRGLGDNDNAFGIMQVDFRFHKPVGVGGDPASQVHIDQATGIFTDYLKEIRKNHPDWEDEYILKGACVAYNSGVGNVQTKLGMDRGTTGDDYGSDVIARAQFYAKRLKSLAQCKAEQMPQTQQKSIAATESSRPITKNNEVSKDIPNILTPTDVNWSDMSFNLTKNFVLGENLLNDIDRIPSDPTVQSNILKIMQEVQKIRDDYGKPITITSGYRPEHINRAVNGVSGSRHISGEAVDICPSDPQADINDFQNWLDQHWYGALGYGAAKGFVHIDCRNGLGWKTGGKKGDRWDY
jgi:uncharacterized protein YcbK (DUF882 family)/soluble lytic murein transglycosylase-like protein